MAVTTGINSGFNMNSHRVSIGMQIICLCQIGARRITAASAFRLYCICFFLSLYGIVLIAFVVARL